VNSRWDGSVADSYDDKWQQMADAGQNPHGEVDFVQRLEPASVLDAGCGTGRVAIELAARGVDVVGADLDAQMLETARSKAPDIDWIRSDLAALDLGRQFDVVVMAGNVILFVQPGTEPEVVAGAARHVAPGGHLVAGFSVDRHVSADAWESWLRTAGLEPLQRFSTWAADPWSPSSAYLVSVAQR
jgi:2-polyprenyl-3-methyl-5-hydroxy-6-metoxy-1,4-benzoquinol methylase